MKNVIAMLSCLVIVSVANAQPKGPAPILKAVSSVDAAKGLIRYLDTRYEQVPEVTTVTVVENGVKVTKNVTTFVTRTVIRTIVINVADSRIITPAGKQIPVADVWKRVKANTVVVVSGDSNAPAGAYLRALHPDTVVIIRAAMKN